MQFLLDHIASVIIAGIIVLILGVLSFRSQSTSLDSTQYYAQKRMLLDLVQMVERDFGNIGSGNSPVGTPMVISFDTIPPPDTPRRLRFRARSDSISVPDHIMAAPSVIAYEWEPVGTVDLRDGTVPVYTVRRRVDGQVAGMSTGNITTFRVDFFSAAGTSVSPMVDSMRVIRVDVKAVSPLGRGNRIEESSWRKVFRPVNLTRMN